MFRCHVECFGTNKRKGTIMKHFTKTQTGSYDISEFAAKINPSVNE